MIYLGVIALQIDLPLDFPTTIPTLWVLAGGCLMTLLVAVIFVVLLWAESRFRLLRRFRVAWRFMDVDALRPFAQNVRGLDQVRRQAGQVTREAKQYAPRSAGKSVQQRGKKLQRQAKKLAPGKAQRQLDDAVEDVADEWRGDGEATDASPPTSERQITARRPAGTAAQTTVPAQTEQPQQVHINVGRLPQETAAETAVGYSPRIPAGQYVDRYQVDALIGEGSIGTVYQAYDTTLARKVTLKVIHPRLVRQSGFRNRFLAAMQEAAKVDHPAIVDVEDYAVGGLRTYLLRAFVPGPALDVYVRHQQSQDQLVSLNETLRLVAQVAEALAHAHRRGLVHGRIQPGNILLKPLDRPEREGDPPLRAMLTDFGLIKLLEEDDTPATTMQAMLPYLSPEHLQDQPLDSRSDIYSLGVVLYQLATQQLPFDVSDVEEAAAKIGETPPAPTAVRPIIPERVEQIILRAIAKNPDERYQSGEELAQALRSVVVKPTDVESVYGERAVEGDQIVVTSEGEPPQIFTVEEDIVTVGADAANDIVLPGKGVAPQHARLERRESGWYVVDLGSLRGTFLDAVQLLPDLPEDWDQEQPLQLGPYTLHWRRATAVVAAAEAEAAAVAGVTEAGAGPSRPVTAVRVALEPEHLTVTPGERVDLQVRLGNRGTQVDHFRLQVEGVSGGWVTISENELQLMPGGRGFVLLSFHPPRHSSAAARDYTFRVVVVSRANPEERAVASGALTIRPFTKLVVDMQPERLRNAGTARVTLLNDGNLPLDCTVSAQDPGEAIRFSGERSGIMLAPGQTEEVALELAAKERPLLGSSQFLPFDVEVATDQSDEPRVKPGQLAVHPYLPVWVPTVIGVLLIFCCTGVFLFGSFFTNRSNTQANATATADSATATAVVAQLAITPTATISPTAPTPVPNPTSCNMIREQTPDVADGEYTLYYQGDREKPYTVHCYNMEKRPAEFLPLPNTGGEFNYSMISYPEGALVTHYQRLRISPATLVVNVTDKTFAESLGTIPGYQSVASNNASSYPVVDISYARAEGCNRGNPDAPQGRANIDLTGTPFIVAETVAFTFQGGAIQGPVVDISDDRKVVNLAIGGRCAHIEPAGFLRLDYAAQAEE